MDDRRRQQFSWKERLPTGQKLRVMVKGTITPPTIVTSGGVTSITPSTVDCWVCQVDEVYTTSGRFRRIVVTDEIIHVAVFDPSLSQPVDHESKDGPYGQVEVIDGIPELTWVGC